MKKTIFVSGSKNENAEVIQALVDMLMDKGESYDNIMLTLEECGVIVND